MSPSQSPSEPLQLAKTDCSHGRGQVGAAVCLVLHRALEDGAHIGRSEVYASARGNVFPVHPVRIVGLYRASTPDPVGFIRAEETGA